MCIEYLSQTNSINILQAEACLIAIDAVFAGRIPLAPRLP